MAEIVDLYARERLLGFELTPAQQKQMATWGEWLDQRVAVELPALATSVGDQEAFARHVRELLAHLGLSEELVEPPEEGDPDQNDADSEQPPAGGDENADGEGEGEEQQQSAAQSERDSGSEEEAEAQASASETAEQTESKAGGEDEFVRGSAQQPAAVPAAGRRRPGLQGLRDPVRRGGHGRGAVRPQRAQPAARPARPVAGPLPGHDRPDGQPAAAQADGAAAALLVVRSRRGHPRHRPPVAGGDQPDHLALVQDGGGDRLPRHGGLAADRQFGLDARPADRRGGDERRHPGPHAGALRGQGRDPGLHHPGLEGRPVARGLAARRQARRPRPAQRPAPHRLQAGRRALAPGAPLAGADAARGPAQGEHRRRGDPVGAPSPEPAPRAAPHPDGDLRRRARSTTARSRPIPATISSATCAR